jgi:hypothetical protein
LIKTDIDGNEEWSKTFSGRLDSGGESVQQTSDGGFIIAGSCFNDIANSFDVYLIKTDELGNEQWSQSYGGSNWEEGYSVQQTSDDGFIIVGLISYNVTSSEILLLKTDVQGNEEWSQNFSYGGENVGHSVQQTSDGGFIIAGQTYYSISDCDIFVIKTDSLGNNQWYQTYGGDEHEYGRCIQITSDGGFIIAGTTWSYGAGCSDVYLIRLGSETGIRENPSNIIPALTVLNPVYPNPFNPTTTLSYDIPDAGFVSLIVYDISGRAIAQLVNGLQPAGSYEITFDGSDLSSGVYFAVLKTEGKTYSQKLLLIK